MTIIKRWEDNGKFYVVQRCRWCDKWTKKRISLGDSTMVVQPTMETQLIKETSWSKAIEDETAE